MYLTEDDKALLRGVSGLDLHQLLLHGETYINDATVKEIIEVVRQEVLQRPEIT